MTLRIIKTKSPLSVSLLRTEYGETAGTAFCVDTLQKRNIHNCRHAFAGSPRSKESHIKDAGRL